MAIDTYPAEMNDVSMTTEVTSVKTTPTQRRSRASAVGRVVTLVQQIARTTQGGESQRTLRWGQTRQSEIDRKDWERAKHRDENEPNKAKIETKHGSEK